jgi:hypothetical protein
MSQPIEHDENHELREQTKRSLRIPAVVLFIFGLFGILMSVAVIGLGLFRPGFPVEVYDRFLQTQVVPQGQKDYEREMFAISYRLDRPSMIAYYALCAILNVAVMYGAIQMIRLGSYRWSLLSAWITACCFSGGLCFGLIVGLWAIIVLLREQTLWAYKK